MTWTLTENEGLTPQVVYEVLKHHRLLPASVELAASACNNIAVGGSHFAMTDGGEEIASVFISGIVHGEQAQLDIVPVAKHFRTGFDDPLRAAMIPLLNILFKEFNLRRITSAIPESRSRTKRALCSLGFKPEGRIRDGVVLHDKPPEDIRILGLLRGDFLEEEDDA
jgi:hypothetical protein